jgi:uncharacterized short protein YbdD (DUF466 family)
MAVPAPLGAAVRAVARAGRVLRGAAASIRWYVTTLMGDHDYERYLARQAVSDPGSAPQSLREYWRSRHEGAAARPRCC